MTNHCNWLGHFWKLNDRRYAKGRKTKSAEKSFSLSLLFFSPSLCISVLFLFEFLPGNKKGRDTSSSPAYFPLPYPSPFPQVQYPHFRFPSHVSVSFHFSLSGLALSSLFFFFLPLLRRFELTSPLPLLLRLLCLFRPRLREKRTNSWPVSCSSASQTSGRAKERRREMKVKNVSMPACTWA